MRIAAVLLLTLFPVLSLAAQEKILVIHSYHSGYEWVESYTKGLEEILGQDYALEYFEMDTKRLTIEHYQGQADRAWRKFLKTGPALVILGDDNALKYLGSRFSETDTPVVYLGINNNPRAFLDLGVENMTGVLERPLLKRSIVSISRIVQPEPKKILVLFDSGTTARVVMEEVFGGAWSTTVSGIRVDLRSFATWEAWKNEVLDAGKNGYEALIVGLYHTLYDASGRHVPDDEVLAWTSRNVPVPPFCFWDFAAGKDKTIGGLLLFGEIQGETAGRLARKILSGIPPASLYPVTPEKGRFIFSRSQLEKWNIELPPPFKGLVQTID